MPPTLDIALDIATAPGIVFDSFFQERTLSTWLGTSRAIAVARVLGPWVLDWRSSAATGDPRGPDGGVLRGSGMEIEPGERVFVADVYWLPAHDEPLGPFALEVQFEPTAQSDGVRSTLVRVVLSGFDEGRRWTQYHELATAQWQRGLRALKTLLEK